MGQDGDLAKQADDDRDDGRDPLRIGRRARVGLPQVAPLGRVALALRPATITNARILLTRGLGQASLQVPTSLSGTLRAGACLRHTAHVNCRAGTAEAIGGRGRAWPQPPARTAMGCRTANAFSGLRPARGLGSDADGAARAGDWALGGLAWNTRCMMRRVLAMPAYAASPCPRELPAARVGPREDAPRTPLGARGSRARRRALTFRVMHA